AANPQGQNARATSYGVTAAFRLIGGSLIPASVNIQLCAAHNSRGTSGIDTIAASTTVLGAVGFSVPLPTPGISIEPYFSPGIRYRNFGPNNGTSTEFGYVFGANLSFGLLGAHVAYDNERLKGGGNIGVFGVGLHLDLHLPLGM